MRGKSPKGMRGWVGSWKLKVQRLATWVSARRALEA